MLPQVQIMPVNVAIASTEEPVQVSDTHQILSNNKTLTAKIHVSTDNRIPGDSESGVITDVLIGKNKEERVILTTKSKRTASWQPWVNISHGGRNTPRITPAHTWYVITRLDNYISHSLATSHFRQNR